MPYSPDFLLWKNPTLSVAPFHGALEPVALTDSSLFNATLLTTCRTTSDQSHLLQSYRKSTTCLCGPTVALVVILSRAGAGNKLESRGVIKGLSLASLNSLAPCWRGAYAELMGFGEEVMGEWNKGKRWYGKRK